MDGNKQKRNANKLNLLNLSATRQRRPLRASETYKFYSKISRIPEVTQELVEIMVVHVNRRVELVVLLDIVMQRRNDTAVSAGGAHR